MACAIFPRPWVLELCLWSFSLVSVVQPARLLLCPHDGREGPIDHGYDLLVLRRFDHHRPLQRVDIRDGVQRASRGRGLEGWRRRVLRQRGLTADFFIEREREMARGSIAKLAPSDAEAVLRMAARREPARARFVRFSVGAGRRIASTAPLSSSPSNRADRSRRTRRPTADTRWSARRGMSTGCRCSRRSSRCG